MTNQFKTVIIRQLTTRQTNSKLSCGPSSITTCSQNIIGLQHGCIGNKAWMMSIYIVVPRPGRGRWKHLLTECWLWRGGEVLIMSEQMSFTYATDVERHYVFVGANIDVGTITPTRQGIPSETSSRLSNTLDKYQCSLGSQLRHVHNTSLDCNTDATHHACICLCKCMQIHFVHGESLVKKKKQ